VIDDVVPGLRPRGQGRADVIQRLPPGRRGKPAAGLIGRNADKLGRAEQRRVGHGLGGDGFQRTREAALRIFDRQVEMDLFIHVVEKGKDGGKDKDMHRGQQAPQPDDTPFPGCRKRSGWGGGGVLTVWHDAVQIKAHAAKHKSGRHAKLSRGVSGHTHRGAGLPTCGPGEFPVAEFEEQECPVCPYKHQPVSASGPGRPYGRPLVFHSRRDGAGSRREKLL
jgi:hypothetical protein